MIEHLGDHIAQTKLFSPTFSEKNSYQVFQIPLPSDPTRKLYFPHGRRITQEIHAIKPHIIVSATPGPFGLFGYLIAKRKQIRLCYGFHVQYDKLAEMYWNRFIGKINSSIMSGLDKRFFQASGRVIAVSDPMVAAAREAGAGKVSLVGTPIAKQFLENPIPETTHEGCTILYAGRLTKEKNIEVTLRVAKQHPQLKFMIAGDGPLREIVEQYSNDCPNLEYLGWLERSSLISVIDQSDLVILPSRNDAFGTIALEAMARNKLVLVSSKCGISSWHSLTKGFYIIENGEPLADAIQRIILLNTQVKEHKAELARTAALDLNTQTVNQWLTVFDEVVHQPLPN